MLPAHNVLSKLCLFQWQTKFSLQVHLCSFVVGEV